MSIKKFHYLSLCLFSFLLLSMAAFSNDETPTKEIIGQRLFFDPILSISKTMSCSTCHDPAAAFADNRDNTSNKAASLGQDMQSLGDRNTPSAAYANQIPAFHLKENGEYVGGFFWDGRANTLQAQAGGPPLNPIEMAMPNKETVAQRLKEDTFYSNAFNQVFGKTIFDSPERLYDAVTESIAAFEMTDYFSPFDSKYDRYLKGEYQLSAQEELGMTLFFSQQFTNCNECHQLNKRPMTQGETFSDYRFHNIGVPENTQLRLINGSPKDHQDNGLQANPNTNHDPKQNGKFKTPSLRNAAITAPYMHNGMFKDLKTVIQFYNKYNSRNASSQINPETGVQWAAPEIDENLALDILKKGRHLDEQRIEALVAFIKLLTDKRYEHLLE